MGRKRVAPEALRDTVGVTATKCSRKRRLDMLIDNKKNRSLTKDCSSHAPFSVPRAIYAFMGFWTDVVVSTFLSSRKLTADTILISIDDCPLPEPCSRRVRYGGNDRSV